jgi:hypothetical protein
MQSRLRATTTASVCATVTQNTICLELLTNIPRPHVVDKLIDLGVGEVLAGFGALGDFCATVPTG